MGCRACPNDGTSYCPTCAAIAVQYGIALPGTALLPPRPALSLPAGASEATMQDKLRGVARGMGYLYHHAHDSRRSDPGLLDTTMVHPEGQTLYLLELKSAEGRVSPAQRRWLDALGQVTQVISGTFYPADWGHLMDILARGAPPR